MNATTKLEAILRAINEGFTVHISNYMHSWAINAACVARFARLGYDVLKVKNDEIYMLSGKKYVCITGCAIKAVR